MLLNKMMMPTLEMDHPSLQQQIGLPAVLLPGEPLPKLRIRAHANMKVAAQLVMEGHGERVLWKLETDIVQGEDKSVDIPGFADARGLYKLHIRMETAGEQPVYDGFTFTVYRPEELRSEQSRIAYLGEDGRMEYVPDYKGNRIPDFSNCGYGGGGVRLPELPNVLTIGPGEGDQTARLQAAIDQVSQLPLSAGGFRGALLLQRGTYHIEGDLTMRVDGVVLRGEGQGEDGTILHAAGKGKRTLIQVGGAGGPELLDATRTAVTDLYVPVGARSFHVADAGSFAVGDTVAVIRHGNADWIHAIGMDSITQRPLVGGTKMWGPFDLFFDRTITAIEGDLITVDAPIANAIERQWGGGTLVKIDDRSRISQVGIENLRVDSDYDPEVKDTRIDGNVNGSSVSYEADEEHCESFAVLRNVKNGWVRDVTGYHLAHALVKVDQHAKWVTVQDCSVREMISVITGGRRYPFHLAGQLSLVQRCDSETARHAFVVNARVAGPNVFLDSESRIDYSSSEPHHRWSVGGLYDNVRSPIYIRDRGWMGSGHGWAGANYVTWNTEGNLTVQQPPTAQNYAIGHVGTQIPPFLPNKYDTRPRRDGFWDCEGRHVEPCSLYLQQLTERLGPKAVSQISQSR
jgi:hypothetical protein